MITKSQKRASQAVQSTHQQPTPSQQQQQLQQILTAQLHPRQQVQISQQSPMQSQQLQQQLSASQTISSGVLRAGGHPQGLRSRRSPQLQERSAAGVAGSSSQQQLLASGSLASTKKHSLNQTHQQSRKLHSSESQQLGVRISQILRQSQRSPMSTERQGGTGQQQETMKQLPIQDQIDQLYEAQQNCTLKAPDASSKFAMTQQRDQVLFSSQKSGSQSGVLLREVSQASIFAPSGAKVIPPSSRKTTTRTKYRSTAKKASFAAAAAQLTAPHTAQASVGATPNSRAAQKSSMHNHTSQEKHSKNKLSSSQPDLQSNSTRNGGGEARSRNGKSQSKQGGARKDSRHTGTDFPEEGDGGVGPIDLRISASQSSHKKVSQSHVKLSKAASRGTLKKSQQAAMAPDDVGSLGLQSRPQSNMSMKELQFNRQIQSKSQCKRRAPGGGGAGSSGVDNTYDLGATQGVTGPHGHSILRASIAAANESNQSAQQATSRMAVSNLKKSFSIALLKAAHRNQVSGTNKATSSMSTSRITVHNNEYSSGHQNQNVQQQHQQVVPTIHSREEQKTPFGMNNYYSHHSRSKGQQLKGALGRAASRSVASCGRGVGGESEYAAASSHRSLPGKRSESSMSGSSIGDVSVNSIKQQAVKNHSHYGALKNLASHAISASQASGKATTTPPAQQQTGLQPAQSQQQNARNLFTRNNSVSNKKLTSFDENVCVNQIRETGIVNQKFNKNLQPGANPNGHHLQSASSSSHLVGTQSQNRFASRKNYGSVCVQPHSVTKNKPLFFSVAAASPHPEGTCTSHRSKSPNQNIVGQGTSQASSSQRRGGAGFNRLAAGGGAVTDSRQSSVEDHHNQSSTTQKGGVGGHNNRQTSSSRRQSSQLYDITQFSKNPSTGALGASAALNYNAANNLSQGRLHRAALSYASSPKYTTTTHQTHKNNQVSAQHQASNSNLPQKSPFPGKEARTGKSASGSVIGSASSTAKGNSSKGLRRSKNSSTAHLELKQASLVSVKQSKLHLVDQLAHLDGKKGSKKGSHARAVKSPSSSTTSGAVASHFSQPFAPNQPYHQQQQHARTTKQTPFVHRNNIGGAQPHAIVGSSPKNNNNLALSASQPLVACLPQGAQTTKNSSKISASIKKKVSDQMLASTGGGGHHHTRKSREFSAAGISVGPLGLNQSSVTTGANAAGSKAGGVQQHLLKQESSVFQAKRKSHGTTIQTRVISSGAMKQRRSSGSHLVGSGAAHQEHNQTQPLEQLKKLRKMTSISPLKPTKASSKNQFNSQPPVQETETNEEEEEKQAAVAQQDNFVEKIVDLLEKRNLINTKTQRNSKPKVNQILQSLLKAHMKNVKTTTTVTSVKSAKQHQSSSQGRGSSSREHQELQPPPLSKSIIRQMSELEIAGMVGEDSDEAIVPHDLEAEALSIFSPKQAAANDNGVRQSKAIRKNIQVKVASPLGVQQLQAQSQTHHKRSTLAAESDASTVYLGTQHHHQNQQHLEQSTSNEQPRQSLPQNKSSLSSSRRATSQRRNPATKYPIPTRLSQMSGASAEPSGEGGASTGGLAGREPAQVAPPESIDSVVAAQGEMTSPGELYYVNHQSKPLGNPQPSQPQASETRGLVTSSSAADSIIYPFVVSKKHHHVQAQASSPLALESPLSPRQAKLLSRERAVTTAMSAKNATTHTSQGAGVRSQQPLPAYTGANSKFINVAKQANNSAHNSRKGSPVVGGTGPQGGCQGESNYYRSGTKVSSSTASDAEKRSEGTKNVYYAAYKNNTGNAGAVGGSEVGVSSGHQLLKESTRYSSNERTGANSDGGQVQKTTGSPEKSLSTHRRNQYQAASSGGNNSSEYDPPARRSNEKASPKKRQSGSQEERNQKGGGDSHGSGRRHEKILAASSKSKSAHKDDKKKTMPKSRQLADPRSGASSLIQSPQEFSVAAAAAAEGYDRNDDSDLDLDADDQNRVIADHGQVNLDANEEEDLDEDSFDQDEEEIQEYQSLVTAIRKHYFGSSQTSSQRRKRQAHFPSTLRCYNVQSIVGKGAFGKVALALHRLTNRPVAIKVIEKTNLQPGQIEKVRSEVALMSAIRHKHIIRLLEVFESKQHMYMVFEYAAGGDLLQLVKKKRCLTERESRSIFRQVVYGVAHCHCRSVLHRDIKLDNILLDDKGNVKVCDFGISRAIDSPNESIMEQCGTPAYIAPEILYEDGYRGFKSDIWGLGVLLYAMVTGTVPFRAQNMRELKQVITAGQFSFPSNNPRDGARYSEDLQDLIQSMLLVDIKRRISVPEILSHPWLNHGQHQMAQQGQLNYHQLVSMHALQPFGSDELSNGEAVQAKSRDPMIKVSQIRVENLFIGHGSDSDENDSSLNARVDSLTLSQAQVNEITIDHATVYINEKAIAKLETYGFPKKLVRAQVQSNVLNHATTSYHLLVL